MLVNALRRALFLPLWLLAVAWLILGGILALILALPWWVITGESMFDPDGFAATISCGPADWLLRHWLP